MNKRIEPWRNGELITYSVGAYDELPPATLSLLLGDTLNNYRAALDHLAWQLVTTAGTPAKAEAVLFPITSNPDGFPSQMRGRMPGVSQVVTSIVRRYQPFTNGERAADHPFALLNQWNNTDKHRTLPVIAMSTTELQITIPGSFENFEVWNKEQRNDRSFEYLLPGTELIRIHGRRRNPARDHGVKVKVEGGATVAHESGRAIGAVLDSIDSVVNSLLTEFEALP